MLRLYTSGGRKDLQGDIGPLCFLFSSIRHMKGWGHTASVNIDVTKRILRERYFSIVFGRMSTEVKGQFSRKVIFLIALKSIFSDAACDRKSLRWLKPNYSCNLDSQLAFGPRIVIGIRDTYIIQSMFQCHSVSMSQYYLHIRSTNPLDTSPCPHRQSTSFH